MKEICICAAIKTTDGYIVRGHRHPDCICVARLMNKELAKGELNQGFVTSENRYVDRFDGYRLQETAGIESVAEGGYRDRRLFSEDLY